MRIAASQPVLSTINRQLPGTPLAVGSTGSGMLGYGLRLPDHLLDHAFIDTIPLGRTLVSGDGAGQMSDEVQKIVLAIADLCGAATPPDPAGQALRLIDALGEGRLTIDLIDVGIDAGELVLMMLPHAKPLSVTLNLIKIGSGLFGIWRKGAADRP